MLIKLILKNNTALTKKGTRSLELDLDDIINIILGRNGYGKTTILKELSQLPPDNADYNEGGYKEVHCKDDRGLFILKSHTGKNSTHEFIFNGKNLNEGQTLTVQKDLVKQHFGVTQNVFNICSGIYQQNRFSMLSAGRRKDFLMTVNPNDTSYGLKVFEKLKSSYNTTRGGLKTQRQRLVVEEQRLKELASLPVEELNAEIAKFEAVIKEALILHGSLQTVEAHDIRSLRDRIANITSRILGTHKYVGGTKDFLTDRLETLNDCLESNNNQHTRLETSLDEVTRQLNGGTADINNIKQYENELALITNKLGNVEISLNENKEFLLTKNLISGVFENKEFSYLVDEFISLVQGVSKAVDETITGKKFNATKEQLVKVTAELNGVNNHINELSHFLQHFNKAEAVDCPECNHNFKIGFNVKDVEEKKRRLVLLSEKKTELEEIVKNLTDYIEDNEPWFGTMSVLHRFIKRTSFSEALLEIIKEYRVGFVTQSVLVDALERTKLYHADMSTKEYLTAEHESIRSKVDFLKGAPIQELLARAEELQAALGSCSSNIMTIKREMAKIRKEIDYIDEYDLSVTQLGILTNELKDKLEENGKYKVKLAVENIINDLSPRKDKLVAQLIRAQSLNSVVESIKENIAELEKREKGLLLLMDGLSPIKGLIGDLMNDFLKSLTGNINAIIKPIWSDRLNILNCSVEKKDDTTELNYFFPVVSGDSPKSNSDVSACSGGEREIIDFVFRVVILRYINKRAGLPLIMDEIGTPFDELHRARFCSFVDEQLRLGKLPQLFMVSHYWAEYTTFVNANLIALNTEGLSIPSGVNLRSKINQ